MLKYIFKALFVTLNTVGGIVEDMETSATVKPLTLQPVLKSMN